MASILAEEGSMLCFGKVKSGCRAYVTFAGGIHIERTMGSKSTYIRAAIGGIEGRMLKRVTTSNWCTTRNGESFHTRLTKR